MPADLGMQRLGRAPAPPAMFRIAFVANAFGVRSALVGLRRYLESAGIPTDQVDRAELVVAEALNNIVEHAYGPTGAGPVTVLCQPVSDGLDLSLRDRGAGMPGDRLPEGRPALCQGPRKDLAEGGFGWFIIRDLARDIRYRRRDGENELSFRLPHNAG